MAHKKVPLPFLDVLSLFADAELLLQLFMTHAGMVLGNAPFARFVRMEELHEDQPQRFEMT